MLDKMPEQFEGWSDEDKAEYVRLFAELAGLSLLTNIHTEYAVFFRYSGHVFSLDVEICKSKDRYNETVASSEFQARWPELDIADSRWQYDALPDMRERVAIMRRILDEAEVPVEDMEEVHETLVTYAF